MRMHLPSYCLDCSGLSSGVLYLNKEQVPHGRLQLLLACSYSVTPRSPLCTPTIHDRFPISFVAVIFGSCSSAVKLLTRLLQYREVSFSFHKFLIFIKIEPIINHSKRCGVIIAVNTVKTVLNGSFIKRNFVLNGNIFRSRDYHSPWLNRNLASAVKYSGPLRFRLRQVLLYWV
jgi:hypothetical protein